MRTDFSKRLLRRYDNNTVDFADKIVCTDKKDYREERDRLDDMVYQKLCYLEDKIENGTLIELPCKIGDTFWYISLANHVEEDKIVNILLRDGMCLGERLVTEIYLRDLGKSWFLTKNEAEAKLKELKE